MSDGEIEKKSLGTSAAKNESDFIKSENDVDNRLSTTDTTECKANSEETINSVNPDSDNVNEETTRTLHNQLTKSGEGDDVPDPEVKQDKQIIGEIGALITTENENDQITQELTFYEQKITKSERKQSGEGENSPLLLCDDTGYEPFMFKSDASGEAKSNLISTDQCNIETTENDCLNEISHEDFVMVEKQLKTDHDGGQDEDDSDPNAENDSTFISLALQHKTCDSDQPVMKMIANNKTNIRDGEQTIDESKKALMHGEVIYQAADENESLPTFIEKLEPKLDEQIVKQESMNDKSNPESEVETDQSSESEVTVVSRASQTSQVLSLFAHHLIFLLIILSLIVAFLTNLYHPLPPSVKDQAIVQTTLMLSGFGYFAAHFMAFLGLGPFSANLRWVQDTALDKNLSSQYFGDVMVSRITLEGVPCVMYRPVSLDNSPAPAALFFHGGGFVVGSAASSDLTTYTLAKETNTVVISVDYRLAPEHPFPAAPDDCIKVTSHVLKKGSMFGVDSSRVGLVGVSAGGNLAAVVAWTLKTQNSSLPPLAFQVLHYPIMQGVDLGTPSHINNDAATPNFLSRRYTGYMLTSYMGFNDKEAFAAADAFESNKHVPEKMRQVKYSDYVSHDFLPEEFQGSAKRYSMQLADMMLYNRIKATLEDPRFSPLMVDDADLQGLPPTFVHAAEFDILRDDALMYERRLRGAGVATELYFSRGGYHSEATVFDGAVMKTSTSGWRALHASYSYIRRQLGTKTD